MAQSKDDKLLGNILDSDAEAATTAVSRRMRVLVVDDNRDAADSMRMLLEASDQDARAAYS
jgi:hypothetical protein